MLSEHFDAVTIQATIVQNGETMYYSTGSGNVFTRMGMAKQFLDDEAADTYILRAGAGSHENSD